MPGNKFMFATGIENSYPTIPMPDGTTKRVDEMEKTMHYQHWKQDFIDWRVKLQVRKPLCKGKCIFGKIFREVRILKIPQPVRNSKMAKVYYWGNT